MTSSKSRNSNIELLRIIAMLMIVIYHISLHAIAFQLTDKSSIVHMGNGYFSYPDFFLKLFFVEAIMPFGGIANNVFILISGYFLLEKDNINVGKVSRKLLFQIGFSTCFLILISFLYNNYFVANISTISLSTIFDFNKSSWFAGYYLIIVVLAVLFLNKYLIKIDQKKYLAFLFVLFGIISLVWPGVVLDRLASGLRNLLCGVFLYSLGGYICRFNPMKKIRTWFLIFIVIVAYLFVFLSYYNVVKADVHNYIASNPIQDNISNFYIQQIPTFDNYLLIPIVIATVLLELFSRIKMKCNRIINFFASCSFMIYIIYDNEFWRCIWRNYDWILLLANNILLYLLMLIKWTIFIFIFGVLSYLLYLGCGKILIICKRLVVK